MAATTATLKALNKILHVLADTSIVIGFIIVFFGFNFFLSFTAKTTALFQAVVFI